MKGKNNLLLQLNVLPHFDKKTVYQLGTQLGLVPASLDVYISRFLARKELHRLKNGLYVSAVFFDAHKHDISYTFYLANVLRTPSYVSAWTALQYYNLTTEVVHPITSVCTKVTRNYKTKVKTFGYQSIQKDLFTDFLLVKGKFSFYIASPAKALFDLLYFNTRQFRGMSSEEIRAYVEELRIDFDEMSTKDQNAFYSMIKKYE